MRGKHRFGLQKKLVVLTTAVATITFSTSAVFLYWVYPFVTQYIDIGETVFTLLTLFLGVVWSGIIAWFAAIVIIKPLQRLEEAAVKAGNGDISESVFIKHNNDEIDSLGNAFNQMLESLRVMVRQIEENGKQTNEIVEAISERTARVAEEAESAAHTISEISTGAESSAAAIQATAESVEDITQIAQEVQEKAKQSEQITQLMLTELTRSEEALDSLISGITDLARGHNESLETVKQLEEHTSKVEEIINLVGDIANQTNLLALNASIEAARAGEHGKGFAVVAEEVRKLADQSATAVQGISELLHTIQSEVVEVVGQITEQVAQANTEVEKGKRTNQTIAKMTETIHESAEAVQTISELVDRQMINVQETSAQAEEVAAIAEETSAGAEEVANMSAKQAEDMEEIDQLTSQLKEQSGKLKDRIARFYL